MAQIVTISFSEQLKYRREMTFEVPDNMSEKELDTLLDKVERKADCSGDVPYILENLNDSVNVLKMPDTDLNSPWDSEIEIDDYTFVK